MRKALKFILVFCLCVAPALAQSNTGRLVGTVSDASGVIPGATVVVKDNKTGKERTVTTSDDGSYSVAQLDPGAYTFSSQDVWSSKVIDFSTKLPGRVQFTTRPALFLECADLSAL